MRIMRKNQGPTGPLAWTRRSSLRSFPGTPDPLPLPGVRAAVVPLLQTVGPPGGPGHVQSHESGLAKPPCFEYPGAMNEPVKLPQPDEISTREKDDAMGAYLMMFASWAVGLPLPAINLVAASIYFLTNRKRSRFVAFHCYQSLLSQLPVTACNVGLVGWLVRNLVTGSAFNPVFFYYLAFTVLVNVLYVIYSIIALARAVKGRFYYMPIFGRPAFERYYGPDAVELVKPQPPNQPPPGV